MKHSKSSVWFQKTAEIPVPLVTIKTKFENTQEFILETMRLMSSITKVVIVKNESDSVTIETNEETILRSNIVFTKESDSITVTFHEKSQAGRLATIESHHSYHIKTAVGESVITVTVSSMRTSGILGYLYKTFSARSNGNAILNTLIKYLARLD